MIKTLIRIKQKLAAFLFGKYERNYELEWRDMKRKMNDQAKVASVLWSDEYRNGSRWKRFWLYLQVFPIDRRASTNIPDHEIEALARCFLPDIIAYFESDEGKAEFAAWKAEQEKLEAEKKTRKTKKSASFGKSA